MITEQQLLKQYDVFKIKPLEEILMVASNVSKIEDRCLSGSIPYYRFNTYSDVTIPVEHPKVKYIYIPSGVSISAIDTNEVARVYNVDNLAPIFKTLYMDLHKIDPIKGGVIIGRKMINFCNLDPSWLERIILKLL